MKHPSRGLIGRDRELSEADEALDAAAFGTPQVLPVGGDAGIGKTSLVAAITDRARDLGFAVLVGHCLDIDDGVALRPVTRRLAPTCGASPIRPPSTTSAWSSVSWSRRAR